MGMDRNRWVRAMGLVMREVMSLAVCPGPGRGRRRVVVVKGGSVYGVR